MQIIVRIKIEIKIAKPKKPTKENRERETENKNHKNVNQKKQFRISRFVPLVQANPNISVDTLWDLLAFCI